MDSLKKERKTVVVRRNLAPGENSGVFSVSGLFPLIRERSEGLVGGTAKLQRFGSTVF